MRSRALHRVCARHAAGGSHPWPSGPSRLFLLPCWPQPATALQTSPGHCAHCLPRAHGAPWPGAGLCTDGSTPPATAPGSEQGQPRCRQQHRARDHQAPLSHGFLCPTATSATVLLGPDFNSPRGVWPQQGKCGCPHPRFISGGCLLSRLKAEIRANGSPKQPISSLKNTS